MKASTKNLLMAAVGIIQHAQEINSATGTAAIKGEQVNYDDVCGRLCADLEDLEKTIEIIASQEESGYQCSVLQQLRALCVMTLRSLSARSRLRIAGHALPTASA